VFATIASDGAIEARAGQAGRLSFANRSAAPLHSLQELCRLEGEPGAVRRRHRVRRAARRSEGHGRAIAAMEILGPNPEATIRYVRDRVAATSLFKPGQLRARDRSSKQARSSSGCGTNIPARCGSPRAAASRSASRPIAQPRQRREARLGADHGDGDIGYGMATRRFNGLPVAGIVATISSC
jgi:hypothetical protein